MSHEITIGDASVTFEEVEIDLDYTAESPCPLGHEFIQAVQKAMTWQGDRYVEPAFTNSETRTDLHHQVRAVLADMLLGTPNVNGETTHEIGNH